MNTRGARNRRIRVALLELLRTEYPGALDLKALRFSMDSLGYPMPEGLMRAQLMYLQEKGLAQMEERRGFGFLVEFASLTAGGWDHLDGLGEGEGI